MDRNSKAIKILVWIIIGIMIFTTFLALFYAVM